MVIHTLYLHVVRVEAVLAVVIIVLFRFVLALCTILCTALPSVAVAHLTVYVEVWSEIPLYVLVYVIHAGRCLSLHYVGARNLGIAAALLQQECRG